MPSFPDSAVILLLVLILFGPKKLPVLARQFGKLMNDFRRASNEFRTQMEDELRLSEQAERQKQITAEASVHDATPLVDPAPASEPEDVDYSSHLPPNDPANDPANEPPAEYLGDTGDSPQQSSYNSALAALPASIAEVSPDSIPIATSGELSILPPSTGLPTPNSEPEPLPQDSITADQATTEIEALHS